MVNCRQRSEVSSSKPVAFTSCLGHLRISGGLGPLSWRKDSLTRMVLWLYAF